MNAPAPQSNSLALVTAFCLLGIYKIQAAPYASGITITGGTTINFTLNEPADLLTYTINGGSPQTLNGASNGPKTFALSSASDTFSITASKNSVVGYTIPTGATIAAATNGLSQASAEGGYNLISISGNGTLTAFNSPRGVAVATNPSNPNFGTAYVSNSVAGTVSGTGGRAITGDGLFAIKADQSDAFNYGNAAQNAGINWTTAPVTPSNSAPYRISVAPDNNIYIADFSDSSGSVYRTSGMLTSGVTVLAGVGGPPAVPSGQFHGSTTAVYVEGTAANGNLTIYTLDEDLTTSNVTGSGSTTDKNSLWSYNLGSNTLATPSTAVPTKINAGQVLLANASSDMDRGMNGLWYLAQNRSAGIEAGITVLSSDGATVLFDSLVATGASPDIFRNIQGISVSLDQKYLAVVLNNSDVAVIPLDPNGIPKIAERMVVNTGTDVNSGRDIVFDAAGNIHYVSSGQAAYRVLSPGGYTSATTSYNGTAYTFAIVPEPTAFGLSVLALGSLVLRRRRNAPSSLLPVGEE